MGFYVPPASCDPLAFEIDGSYTPPACDMLNFDSGGTAPWQILTHDVNVVIDSPAMTFFQGDTITTHTVTIGVEFSDSLLDIMIPIGTDHVQIGVESDDQDIEILPDMIIDGVSFDVEADHMIMRGTEEQHLPTKIDPGINMSWEKENHINRKLCLPAGDGEHQIVPIRIPFKEETRPDHEVRSPWYSMGAMDWEYKIPYEEFPIMDWNISSSWIGMLHYQDVFKHVIWDTPTEFDWKFCMSYNAPSSHDHHKNISWDTPVDWDWKFCASYNAPGNLNAQHCVAWGPFSYYTLCYDDDKYYPPRVCQPIQFAFPNKYPMHDPLVCSNIGFHLNTYATVLNKNRCPFENWHSGIRDRYPGITLPPESDFPSARQVYYMMNTVLVKEYITNRPVEVLGVSMTIDRDSWLWQFQVTVASRDCLEVIMPQDGVFINIVIQLNGYEWLCTVESWSENRAFGKDAWTITGRSPSLVFGDPMDPKKSDTVSGGRTGQQLLDDIVGDKEVDDTWPGGTLHMPRWAADWTAYNPLSFDPSGWHVPGGTLSYSDQTSIQVMQTIAGSIGAYINTDPSESVFHIKPMYAFQPWNWELEGAIEWNHIIEDQCIEIGRNYDLRSDYQAVYVAGESRASDGSSSNPDPADKATFAKVCKDGFCSSDPSIKYGPMVTDALITHSSAARERGRMVLGDCGEWVIHTLKLNVLCPQGSGLGLFQPGDMIKVLERGVAWGGQVTGTNVSAANSGNGFVVQQVVTVEQYIGD